MIRQLAEDAYRSASRTYVDERKQFDKMARKHGDVAWHSAHLIALRLHLRHGDEWCAAKIIDAIADQIAAANISVQKKDE